MMRWGGYHAVAHSRAVRADTARALHTPVESVSYIPLGVDARERDALAGREFRSRHGISLSERVVLYTGSAPNKNIELFAQVAREVLRRFPSGVSCVLITSPEIARAGIGPRPPGIRIIPFQTSLIPALEAADLFLSTADYEGFGLSITEAMYTGVPVVSTAVGGVVDQVVHGTTGYLTPAGDLRGLVDHTSALLANDDLRQQMGASARRHVQQNFTTARVVQDFQRLYEDLAAPHTLAD
jgi:glycosyltransferase involved in cell wall biosynthesis